MATTLPEVLQAPNLLGYVESVKAGLPSQHLPPALLGGATVRRTEGNTFSYHRYSGSRKVTNTAAYGSASRGRTIGSLGELPGKTMYTSNNVELKYADYMNLMNPEGGQRQRLGESEVARAVRETVTDRMNFRIAATTSAFALGHIYLGSEGELLPSSSNAVQDIDYAIPANNQNQLNGIIGTTWATSTVDVLGDLQAIHAAAVQTSGYPLKHAIYGANILGYLMTNTNIRDLIVRNPVANNAAINTMVFNVGGLTWWPGYFGFFEDSTGTNRTQISGDTVIFIPEPDRSWYEVVEGTTPVATDGGLTNASAESMTSMTDTQQGMWQYAVRQTDPVGAKIVHGDNMLPVIKVPSAVFIADVVP